MVRKNLEIRNHQRRETRNRRNSEILKINRKEESENGEGVF